jgi:hypothetical protein
MKDGEVRKNENVIRGVEKKYLINCCLSNVIHVSERSMSILECVGEQDWSMPAGQARR